MPTPLSARVRVGIPGSLTIELDAFPPIQQQSIASKIFPQLQTPVLTADDKLFSLAWGQGWVTQISKRLSELGATLRLDLVVLECPSLDQADMAWGATGTIDATTDPVTLQVTPFGASVYGRAFAVGDYIIWNNPVALNGRYQYEIDQITAIQQNTFTLARRGAGAAAGFAQFGSVKAAQSGQFLQLLDKTFLDLWDGSHQVFKFLWDGMIVAAVLISSPATTQTALVNLFPLPPAAAAMGLDLGSSAGTGTSGMAPPASSGTGGTPLGPDGTPAGTPLPPSIPVVAVLPNPAASSVGQYVMFQGSVYIFTAPPSGSGDGYWAFDTTGSPSIRDAFANLGLYPAANYALGTVFVATDLSVAYAVQSVAGVKVWIYYNGIYEAPLASIPATLGIYDTGFTFRASDYLHNWLWTGTAWSLIAAARIGFQGGLAPGSMLFANPGPPFGGTSQLWHLCDGSTQDVSQEDATVVATVLPTIANTWFVR